jgi:hypothetical protein
VRPDLQHARRILAERGLEGLREALAAGVPLPALAALFAGPFLPTEEGQR